MKYRADPATAKVRKHGGRALHLRECMTKLMSRRDEDVHMELLTDVPQLFQMQVDNHTTTGSLCKKSDDGRPSRIEEDVYRLDWYNSLSVDFVCGMFKICCKTNDTFECSGTVCGPCVKPNTRGIDSSSVCASAARLALRPPAVAPVSRRVSAAAVRVAMASQQNKASGVGRGGPIGGSSEAGVTTGAFMAAGSTPDLGAIFNQSPYPTSLGRTVGDDGEMVNLGSDAQPSGSYMDPAGASAAASGGDVQMEVGTSGAFMAAGGPTDTTHVPGPNPGAVTSGTFMVAGGTANPGGAQPIELSFPPTKAQATRRGKFGEKEGAGFNLMDCNNPGQHFETFTGRRYRNTRFQRMSNTGQDRGFRPEPQFFHPGASSPGMSKVIAERPHALIRKTEGKATYNSMDHLTNQPFDLFEKRALPDPPGHECLVMSPLPEHYGIAPLAEG